MKQLVLFFFITLFIACEKEKSSNEGIQVENYVFSSESDLKPVQGVFVGEELFVLSTSEKNQGLQLDKLNKDGELLDSYFLLDNTRAIARSLTLQGDKLIITSSVNFGGVKNIQLSEVHINGNLKRNEIIFAVSDEKTSKLIQKNETEWLLAGYRRDEQTGLLGILLYVIDKGTLTVKSEKYLPGIILSVAADVKSKSDGSGFYLFGHEIIAEGEETDLVLYELNNNLEIIGIQNNLGGAEYEEASEIIVDPEGYIYLLGHSASEDIHHNVYLAKLNLDLDIVFEKQYGGLHHDGGESFTFNDDHNFSIVARSNSTPSGDQSIMYLRIDKSGNQLENYIFGNDLDNRSDYILHSAGIDYIIGYTLDENNINQMEIFKVFY